MNLPDEIGEDLEAIGRENVRKAVKELADYAKLPEPIKAIVGPVEYFWLSDAEKARLVQSETEPEA